MFYHLRAPTLASFLLISTFQLSLRAMESTTLDTSDTVVTSCTLCTEGTASDPITLSCGHDEFHKGCLENNYKANGLEEYYNRVKDPEIYEQTKDDRKQLICPFCRAELYSAPLCQDQF